MNFLPLEDRVLINPIPVETQTESGILLTPTNTNSTPTSGTVVAVGSGRNPGYGHTIHTRLKAGDKVVWTKFAGGQITVDGQGFLLMRESDIVGILT